MIKAMIIKIDDQTNDPITNDQYNDHFTASLSMPHYQFGNVSLVTINYIISKGVKLRE